jgi:pyruvate kinase
VYPVVTKELNDIDGVIKDAVKISKDKLQLVREDRIIITGGFPLNTQNKTNFMEIEEIE